MKAGLVSRDQSKEKSCCEGEDLVVIGADTVEVSKSGYYLLLEVIECQGCKHKFISPYIALPDLDPIPDDFSIKEISDENGEYLEILPSYKYVKEVLGIPKRNIHPQISLRLISRSEKGLEYVQS